MSSKRSIKNEDKEEFGRLNLKNTQDIIEASRDNILLLQSQCVYVMRYPSWKLEDLLAKESQALNIHTCKIADDKYFKEGSVNYLSNDDHDVFFLHATWDYPTAFRVVDHRPPGIGDAVHTMHWFKKSLEELGRRFKRNKELTRKKIYFYANSISRMEDGYNEYLELLKDFARKRDLELVIAWDVYKGGKIDTTLSHPPIE